VSSLSSASPNCPTNEWRQGELIEIIITDVNHDGEGVGRFEGRVVFVPDTVPGDRLLVRLLRVKPHYAHGRIQELLEASPQRIRPHCIVADKCGGCQWQHIDYPFQLSLKQNLIIQDLNRLGGFQAPPVDPVLAEAESLGYRNKVTYPVGRSQTGQVQAGYYQKGTHHIINLNQCPIQDPRLTPLLQTVKQDMQTRGWSLYNEQQHRGKVRHLGLRIGRRTGEMLLTLVTTDSRLTGLEEQAQAWLEQYPTLVGVALNINPDRTNSLFGKETLVIAGQSSLREEFAGLQFYIQPTTFFQVNTEQAEALVQVILEVLDLQGTETVVDAYAGIGTLTLPLATRVQHAIALEVQPDAVEQARQNAALNGITNVRFETGTVETLLPDLDVQPDIVLLDPPRKGCDRTVIDTLLYYLQPARIVYMSCNPSTLARDLKGLCEAGVYRLTRVQPADFFPQTAHVECVAFLEKA